MRPLGFTKVTDRKEMRFVTARPFLVIVAAHHALRFLDARIRRIFGRSVERHVFDSRPPSHVQNRAPWVRLVEALRRRRDAIEATASL